MQRVFTYHTGHPVLDTYALRVRMDDYTVCETALVPRAEVPDNPPARNGESEEMFVPLRNALIDWETGDANPWRYLLIDMRDTLFQEAVSEFLRSTNRATLYSYGQVAKSLGDPKAARAVARACAGNPVPLLVACHRIVPAQTARIYAARYPEIRQEAQAAGPFPASRRGVPKRALRLAQAALCDLDLGGYAGGTELKRALLEYELAWKLDLLAKSASRQG